MRRSRVEIPYRNGDEQDYFSRWRRVLSWASGEAKRIKRGYHKRCRRVARAEADECALRVFTNGRKWEEL